MLNKYCETNIFPLTIQKTQLNGRENLTLPEDATGTNSLHLIRRAFIADLIVSCNSSLYALRVYAISC